MNQVRKILDDIPGFYLILISLTLILAISSIIISIQFSSDPVAFLNSESIKEELIAVGDENLAPFSYLEDGKPSGYDVDIIRAIEDQFGKKITIRLMPWSEAIDTVTSGEADILLGVSQTDQRREILDFPERTITQRSVFFVDKDRFLDPTLDPLHFDGVVGVRTEGANKELVRAQFPTSVLKEFPSQEDAILALSRGEVDMFAGNYYVGLYDIQKDHLENQIKVLGTPFGERQYGPAVRKGNTNLQSALTHAIEDLKNQGEIKKIQDKWFGLNYFSDNIRVYLLYALVIALLSILVLVVYSLVLRKYYQKLHYAVELRTAELKQSEERVKTQYSILQGILQSTESGVYSVDTNYHYTCFNSSHARAMKERYKVDIEVGMSILDFRPSDEDREKVTRSMERALLGEHFSVTDYSGAKGNPDSYFKIVHNPIRSSDGVITGVAIFTRDITPEIILKNQNNKSLQQINKNMETLAILNDQIRNPLTVMMILTEDLDHNLIEQFRKQIQYIDDIITQLDKGWIESEKVRSFLMKHYGMNLSENEIH